MNILLISYEYPPIGAGGANAAYHIGRSLAALGHGVTVMTAAFREKRGLSVEEGIHVFRIPAFRAEACRAMIKEMISFVLSGYIHAGRIIRERSIDRAVIFFSVPSGLLGPWIKAVHRVPYVVSLRGGDVPGLERRLDGIHRMIRPVRRAVLKRALSIVANSKGLALASEKEDPFRVAVIPNGVDTEFFCPAVPAPDKAHGFTLLFAGRFHEQKNLVFLLDQFAAFAGSRADAHLVLAGDGHQRGLLHGHAKALGIEDRVSWKGWIGKGALRDLYRQADCLVNPSVYEGMPNVVLEAMACGLPVAASDIMGNNELVADGVNGFLFKPGDEAGFRTALERCSADRAKGRELGKKSRELAVELHSWKSVAAQYLALLSEKQPSAQSRSV